MTHEPVALTVAWLTAAEVAPLVTSMRDPRDDFPALIVARVTGGPLSDASGIDTVYDWTLTLYCMAGKTGPGYDYPDTQAAHQVVGNVMDAARSVSRGTPFVTEDGVRIIAATVLSAERGVDEAGNARATVTVTIRVAE